MLPTFAKQILLLHISLICSVGILFFFFVLFFFPPLEKKKEKREALWDSFQLMLHVVTCNVKLHLLRWNKNIRETLWHDESQHNSAAGTFKTQHGFVVSNLSPDRDEVFSRAPSFTESVFHPNEFFSSSEAQSCHSPARKLLVTFRHWSWGKFCLSEDLRIRPRSFYRLWCIK